ncbi:unnamed protein product [Thelazia callipaeda]|uniref:Dephospho-CoA kinase domain-containing protein n=1 Tax=Thelazia callipaeda TaxID=103827 RepID=A0A0N5CVJ3_THECL|nr:unnamed protein product [Thelazia callipaeda]
MTSLYVAVMYLVGLTGGIATGKSTVSEIFMEKGIPVIDADCIAREVVTPGSRAYKKLRKHFGDEYFDSISGELLRKKFGDLVFDNEEVRSTVNSITHPEIFRTIVRRILYHFIRGDNFVVIGLPLLFEAGYANFMQKIVVVDCIEGVQLVRLIKRDHISLKAARKRIRAQIPMSVKRRWASYIVENSGSLEKTREQVLDLILHLQASKLHLLIRFGMLFIFMFLLTLSLMILW